MRLRGLCNSQVEKTDTQILRGWGSEALSRVEAKCVRAEVACDGRWAVWEG